MCPQNAHICPMQMLKEATVILPEPRYSHRRSGTHRQYLIWKVLPLSKEKAERFISVHAGLTEDEMLIPLIVVEKE
jgi:hypothetical protein